MPFGRREMPDIAATTTHAVRACQKGVLDGYVNNWSRRPSLWGTDVEFEIDGESMDAAMAIEVIAFREGEMYNARKPC